MQFGTYQTEKQPIYEGRITQIYKAVDHYKKDIEVIVKKFGVGKAAKLRKAIKEEGHFLLQYKPKSVIEVLQIQETLNSVIWITKPATTSLREQLNKQRQLDLHSCQKLAHDLIVAYRYLVELNVMHQNLEPQGILLYQDKYIFSDLGIGNTIEECTYGVKTPYISPEKSLGQPYSAKCDIWSIGVILYEAYFGFVPSLKENTVEFQQELNINVPLENFLIKCLEYSEDKRLGWRELVEEPFVRQVLQLRLVIDETPAYLDFVGHFKKIIMKVNIQVLFGVSSQNNDIVKLTQQEFIQGALKLDSSIKKTHAIDLFHQIVGFNEEYITTTDIHIWLNMKKDLLLQNKEELLDENQNMKKSNKVIQYSQQLTQLKNKQYLTKLAVTLLKSIKLSIETFNTSLDSLFHKYDPNNIGGIDKENFDKIVSTIYKEKEIDDQNIERTFLFLNQFNTGKISRLEMEYCLYKTDLDKLEYQDK